jgi:hypothetical protein
MLRIKEMVSGVEGGDLVVGKDGCGLEAKRIQATWVSIKLRAREWCGGL